MSLFDWFRRRRRKRRWTREAVLRSRAWELSQTIDSTSRLWQSVEDVAGNSIEESVLAVYRAKALHEWRHDAYARGIAQTYAGDVVGAKGPRLKIHSRREDGSEDEEWNDALLWQWQQWQRRADVTGRLSFSALLRQAVRALFPAGEALFLRVIDAESLRLQAIAAMRLVTPTDNDDEQTKLGITLDSTGRPVAYHFSDGGALQQTTRVPAERVLHYFPVDLPEQLRGIPLLACSLETGAVFRDWIKASLSALQLSAKFGVVLESDLPPADLPTIMTDDDEATDEDEVPILDIPSGAIVPLPDGMKATQIKPEHPPALFAEFAQELQRRLGRAIGMPRIRVAADSSDSNYSAARLDVQSYWRLVQCEQEQLETTICEPCLFDLARLGELSGRLPRAPVRWWASWTWPSPPVIDEIKEAQAAMLRLASHRSTLAEEAVGDWQDTVRMQARIERLAADEGTSVLPAQVRMTLRGNAAVPGAAVADEVEALVEMEASGV